MASTRSTRFPACRTICCSTHCSRRRTRCARCTPATSRPRPIWRSARRWRPASRRPTPWCPGPGLLNSSAALLTAYSMNAPVLALIGQIPEADIGRDLGHLHEIRDQAGIISRLVDHSARIRKPQDASRLTAQALRAMFTGRPGPAALECAMDMWGKPGPVTIEQPRAAPTPKIDDGRDPQGGEAARRGEAADDPVRRRRAGRFRGGHGAVRHAAGAGARLSPRPRRARQPRPVQRDAAARPRPVGRGRCRARRSARAC